LARNKKLRGEATLAVLRALPATLPQIVERTGLKKTSASTMLDRLQNDGLVVKAGDALIPGYEFRSATVYDLDHQ
jgi:DNA-binding IclR family transcriptional regulator